MPMSHSLSTLLLVAGVVAVLQAGSPGSEVMLAQEACSPARPHDPGAATETLTTGGFARDYIIYTPPSYDGESAMPLVLNLHGLGSHAQEQMEYSDLDEKADVEGFIVVAPQGTNTEFIPARHWNFSTLETFDDTPDDVAFISALLDRLEQQLCIDTARVYATGMSNGAQMSVRVACNLSDRVAAIAPVAGSYFPPAFVQIPGEPGCDTERPVPVIAFHGTADSVIKFEGGPLGLAIPFDTRPIETAVISEWATHNGCDGSPLSERVSEHVRVVRYPGCEAAVELYVVDGGRHEWPGAPGGPSGAPEADEISANDLLWDFFERHTLSGTSPVTAAPPDEAAALAENDNSDGNNVWFLAAGAFAVALAVLGVGFFLRRATGPQP
jgi:polyhydroxybutyrate depolymerase